MTKPLLFAQQVLDFYAQLRPPGPLPRGFEVLFPFADPTVRNVMQTFYTKYFNDANRRVLLIGINPGRLGAGVTGINFTAPRQLSAHCGIMHPFKDQSELSAEFIYRMIDAIGGVAHFYRRFFIGAVSPLGYTYKGVNKNYYDHPQLLQRVTPFILTTMEQQLQMNLSRNVCICIGAGKNLDWLKKWNAQYGWFGEIRSLPHPRFIMQYRRKKTAAYLKAYIDALTAVESA